MKINDSQILCVCVGGGGMYVDNILFMFDWNIKDD